MTAIKSDMEDHFKSLPLDDQELVTSFIDFLAARREKADVTVSEEVETATDDLADEKAGPAEVKSEELPEVAQKTVAKDDEELEGILEALELHQLHRALRGAR